MSPLALAWRSLTRQPARAWLGIAGIAIVGALLFNMLLLSRGLATSFRELLDEVGYDVRVTANRSFPAPGPRLENSREVLAVLEGLREVERAVPVRFGRAEAREPGGRAFLFNFMGFGGEPRNAWTVLEGKEFSERIGRDGPGILINEAMAEAMQVRAGDTLPLRGACERRWSSLPVVDFEVVGVVEFLFDVEGERTTVVGIEDQLSTCDPSAPDTVDFFFVASAPGAGPGGAVPAIRETLPDLHTFSNVELVDRLQARDFSYFRQISFALSSITLVFAFLLIATLLTVSVNQRLGEVAALRALGFRRSRVVADLLWESGLLVASGGLLALPLGGLLALELDSILRSMPGIPSQIHFFVFQPRAVVLYAVLLSLTGLVAALYPLVLVARVPIAATLRKETVS